MANQPEIEYKASPLRRLLWSIVFIALLAGAGVALWQTWRLKQVEVIEEAELPQPTQPAGETPAPDEATASPDEFVARADTAVHFPPPPASADSDIWLQQQLPVVEPNPRFNDWLVQTDDILPKLVLLVHEVAQGKVPRRVFTFWAPSEPFQVKEAGEGRYV
ncbi:MAG TPA: hypothetical protein ENI90_02385, partial [Methylothermaceae bacterium]|nr:hypothetical protein [Methylothermaceae bacterium]